MCARVRTRFDKRGHIFAWSVVLLRVQICICRNTILGVGEPCVCKNFGCVNLFTNMYAAVIFRQQQRDVCIVYL